MRPSLEKRTGVGSGASRSTSGSRVRRTRRRHHRADRRGGGRRGQSERLQAEQARRQPDAVLSQQNKVLAHQLLIKQQLLSSLTAREMLKSSGFAVLLADLARIRSPGIALQHIQFDEGRIALSGLATSSQDVPAWVNRFAETEALSGKAFSELEISRDSAGQLSFRLSSPQPEATASAAVATQQGNKS